MKNKIPLIYSYTIPYDDGAAPNPYWGTLTLAICKPVIRRTAEIGDWIVATGSKNSPIGDIQNSIVYVMEISNKMTMQEYDIHCRKELPNKIPNIESDDKRLHVGDCIYDFSSDQSGTLRSSVHDLGNKDTDLGGKNVLLSNHFYYFGDHPLFLPEKFQCIIKPNQGHKSKSNSNIVEEFIEWVTSLEISTNSLVGKPQIKLNLKKNKDEQIKCAKRNCQLDKLDEKEWKERIC